MKENKVNLNNMEFEITRKYNKLGEIKLKRVKYYDGRSIETLYSHSLNGEGESGVIIGIYEYDDKDQMVKSIDSEDLVQYFEYHEGTDNLRLSYDENGNRWHYNMDGNRIIREENINTGTIMELDSKGRCIYTRDENGEDEYFHHPGNDE